MKALAIIFALMFALPARWTPIVVAAPIEELFPPSVDIAVNQGLSYLARQQQTDGSFTGLDEPGPRVAPTAEVMLAYLSAGQTPQVGRHALSLRNAMEFVLRQLPDDGGFGIADGSGMEGQAIITIALAEYYGFEADSTQRSSIKEALDRSRQFIVSSQDQKQGGWTAEGKREPDLVSTCWMVMSLHALADSGVEIPQESLDRAGAFVLSRGGKAQSRGYSELNGEPTAISNAAGLIVIHLTRAKPRGQVAQPLKFLIEKRPDENKPEYHTALYTSTVAAFLWGEPAWSTSWKMTRDRLVAKQTEDGSWFPPVMPAVGLGTISATSKGVMTLALPYRFLPLYGR